MTKKFMLGIFLASLLLMANLAFAGDRSSPAPVIAKMGLVPSVCGCLNKDKTPTSPGLKPDVLTGNPNRAPSHRNCWWECWWYWDPNIGDYIWDCMWVCSGQSIPPHL
jgi:hypothetical protein